MRAWMKAWTAPIGWPFQWPSKAETPQGRAEGACGKVRAMAGGAVLGESGLATGGGGLGEAFGAEHASLGVG
ncbi:MAG: hypothetical protein WDN45_01265 [Caulobacteraceae bacterium]